jgi:hypothetical protein
MTDHVRRHTCKTAAALLATVLMLMGACSDDDDGAAPADAPTGEPATTSEAAAVTTPTTGAGDVEPSELTFTFTGESGEAGCRYEGPPVISPTISSTLTNAGNQPIFLSLARLAEGATAEDSETAMLEFGDEFPVMLPIASKNAGFHDWMQGDWLELHTTGAGASQTVEREAMFEGDYVAFCWLEEPLEGIQVWSGGSLRVER